MKTFATATAIILLSGTTSTTTTTHAFSFTTGTASFHANSQANLSSSWGYPKSHSKVWLCASTSDDDGDDDVESNANVKNKVEEQEDVSSETEVDDKEEVEEEDPEITALKEEISKLEAKVKSKRFVLNDVRDRADDYTESGYLRQVAEMDNYRKRREITTQNNRFSGRAAVVSQLMPILEELEDLEVKFDRDLNGYKALRWDLQNVLTEKLDVEEFSVEAGDDFSNARHASIGEELSDTIAKDLVIQEVKKGLEIKGNVIRQAEVIKSLGKEQVEENQEEQSEEEDNVDS